MIPNEGEVEALTKYTAENLFLRLYSNNLTPVESNTVASFTEVVGGGYAAISLPTSERVIVAGDPSTCTYLQKTFTFTGVPTVPTVYGVYITNNAGTKVLGAERFSSAVVPINPINGTTIKVTPRLLGS